MLDEIFLYFVGRTASGRPTLQHLLRESDTAVCGLDISRWTKQYQAEIIPVILCKKCARHVYGKRL